MTINNYTTASIPQFLTGTPRGEHHASCLESYFGLGLPEADRWVQFDLQNPDDRSAHQTFTSLLGIPQPTFKSHSPEYIFPKNLHIPAGSFLTRQAFNDEELQVIYRAGFGTP